MNLACPRCAASPPCVCRACPVTPRISNLPFSAVAVVVASVQPLLTRTSAAGSARPTMEARAFRRGSIRLFYLLHDKTQRSDAHFVPFVELGFGYFLPVVKSSGGRSQIDDLRGSVR